MTETTIELEATGRTAAGRYVEFWNASSAEEQRRIADEAFAPDVDYHVPLGVMRGVEQLVGFREQFAERMPDYRFRARTAPDAHHDRARLQWELVVDGESFATGTDVLALDTEGRIVSVTGFLDRAPAGFDPHAHH
ncbi:MAG TPA: nuclear transport factor 2 family protein [Nocardioides sp.]|nr:nuclear transport factor 2 family protein [Nocardioides sp.]